MSIVSEALTRARPAGSLKVAGRLSARTRKGHKMAKEKLDFVSVDISSLPANLRKECESILETQKRLEAQKAAFQAAFVNEAVKRGKLPEGGSFLFGWRFGQLAIAAAPEKSAKKGGFSF